MTPFCSLTRSCYLISLFFILSIILCFSTSVTFISLRAAALITTQSIGMTFSAICFALDSSHMRRYFTTRRLLTPFSISLQTIVTTLLLPANTLNCFSQSQSLYFFYLHFNFVCQPIWIYFTLKVILPKALHWLLTEYTPTFFIFHYCCVVITFFVMARVHLRADGIHPWGAVHFFGLLARTILDCLYFCNSDQINRALHSKFKKPTIVVLYYFAVTKLLLDCTA